MKYLPQSVKDGTNQGNFVACPIITKTPGRASRGQSDKGWMSLRPTRGTLGTDPHLRIAVAPTRQTRFFLSSSCIRSWMNSRGLFGRGASLGDSEPSGRRPLSLSISSRTAAAVGDAVFSISGSVFRSFTIAIYLEIAAPPGNSTTRAHTRHWSLVGRRIPRPRPCYQDPVTLLWGPADVRDRRRHPGACARPPGCR
jgi:hypothetical protein